MQLRFQSCRDAWPDVCSSRATRCSLTADHVYVWTCATGVTTDLFCNVLRLQPLPAHHQLALQDMCCTCVM